MGFFDGLFEPEMRNLNKEWMNKENEGHTLSREQVEDTWLAQRGSNKSKKQPKKKSFWDELFGGGSTPRQGDKGQRGWLDW